MEYGGKGIGVVGSKFVSDRPWISTICASSLVSVMLAEVSC